MKKMYAFLFLTFFSLASVVAQDQKEQLPQNAKIISQFFDEHQICYTMIDLDNNEMVIVIYDNGTQWTARSKHVLYQVIRTGIKINPEEQESIKVVDSREPDSD